MSGPHIPPVLRAFLAAIDDGAYPQPEEDRGLEPSLIQADDFLPMGEMAALAAKAKGAVAGAGLVGKLKGALAASKLEGAGLSGLGVKLKDGIKFDRYRRVMQGVNPLDLTAKELGKHVASIGPDLQSKTLRLSGAQLMDEFPGADPKDLTRLRFGATQPHASLEYIPPVHLDSKDPAILANPNMFGGFRVDSTPGALEPRSIHLNPSAIDKAFPGQALPEEIKNGVLAHEIQHALDHASNPWKNLASYKPQLPSPENYTNDAFARAGWFGDSRLEELLRRSARDPALSKHFLDQDMIEKINRGYSPNHFSHLHDILPQKSHLKSDAGNLYRMMGGNSGFKGIDPYTLERVRSIGHFDTPIGSDLDIPVMHLAQQQAKLGGDIGEWEDTFYDMAKEARANYKSNAVQVPQLPTRKPFPWQIGAGVAAGAAGAGFVTGYQSGKGAQAADKKPFVGPPEGAPRPGQGAGSLEQFRRLMKERRDRGQEPQNPWSHVSPEDLLDGR